MLGARMIQTRAMRHGAGSDALDLNHLVGSHDRDRGRNHIAVKIGVGYVDEVAVGGNVGGCGEHSQARVLDSRVDAGAVFPERALGTAVSLRNIDELLVRRDRDAVRAVDVGGHQADARLTLDAGSAGAETDQHDLVGGFTYDVDEIVLRGRLRSGGRSSLSADCLAEGYRHEQAKGDLAHSREKAFSFWTRDKRHLHRLLLSPLVPQKRDGPRRSAAINVPQHRTWGCLLWTSNGALRRRCDQRSIFREYARRIARLRSLPLRHALPQQVVTDFDLQQLLADVKVNHVAIANAGDGASECGFGRDVSGHQAASC